MPHFPIYKKDINNDIITVLDTETVSHLVSSMRVKKGETVKFIDEDEIVYRAEILTADKKSLTAKILESKKSERKLNINLCAVISVLKPDAYNLAIQNAVQCGVKEIYTVFSDNAAVKKASVINKQDKWQKIAMESFKQCERADKPKVFNIDSFKNIFSNFKKENIIIFAEKYDFLTVKEAVKTVNKSEKILLVFGPEGGFSEDEFNYFKQENLKLATLGKLIFKAPNAVTAGVMLTIENL